MKCNVKGAQEKPRCHELVCSSPLESSSTLSMLSCVQCFPYAARLCRLQGHCYVCHSSVGRSLQFVCAFPVLVFDLSIKHEVVLGQGWGSVVRC